MAELSANEQLMLELVNRARLNPLGEVVRQGLSSLNQGLPAGTITAAPKQALAPNLQLADAARLHSQWMIDTDTFSHTGAGGSDAGGRMSAAGYAFTGSWAWGENIAAQWSGGEIDITQYTLDEHRGLFRSAGHRENILADQFKEIGIGGATGDYAGSNALMITQDFARSGSSVFVTGVAYDDADHDNFYDVGEARSGIGVSATVGGSTASGVTATAGGYALGVGSGTATVTFSGGGLAAAITVVVSTAGGNAKVDLVDGARIETSVSATLGTNATSAALLGAVVANLTGNAADNALTGNKVGNTLDGGGGNDTILGGAGCDIIYGGVGNDRLSGGAAADKLQGMTGNDIVVGGAGNDTINGGAGADSLGGGTEKDTFVFNTALGATNVDRITDFATADDTIWLDDAAFTGMAVGVLSAEALGSGSVASTAAQRILYDAATGALYFDRDGAGGAAAVKFAILAASTVIAADDFVVV